MQIVWAVSHIDNEEQTRWSEQSTAWKRFIPALGWAALSNEVMHWLRKTHGLVHRWWRLKPQWLLLAVHCLTDLGDKVRNGDGVYFVLVPLVLKKRRRKVSFMQPLLFIICAVRCFKWLDRADWELSIKTASQQKVGCVELEFCWDMLACYCKRTFFFLCGKGQHIFGKSSFFVRNG